MPQWPRQKDVPAFYGARGQNLKRLIFPYPMFYAGKPIASTLVHSKVYDSALKCFQQIAKEYPDPAQRKDMGIDAFSGCLNVRKMRGGNSWSMHSWAIAIDFDAGRNMLQMHKPAARLSKPDAKRFWEIWESEGWVSLGRAKDFDWMHVQAARL